MGGIKTFISGDLTLKRFTGFVTANEWLDEIEDFYLSDRVTRNLVWDLSKASLTHLRSEDLRAIARSVHTYSHARVDGKTALITSTDLDFAICKVLAIYTERKGIAPKTRIFRTLPDAARWIGVDRLPPFDDE